MNVSFAGVCSHRWLSKVEIGGHTNVVVGVRHPILLSKGGCQGLELVIKVEHAKLVVIKVGFQV